MTTVPNPEEVSVSSSSTSDGFSNNGDEPAAGSGAGGAAAPAASKLTRRIARGAASGTAKSLLAQRMATRPVHLAKVLGGQERPGVPAPPGPASMSGSSVALGRARGGLGQLGPPPLAATGTSLLDSNSTASSGGGHQLLTTSGAPSGPAAAASFGATSSSSPSTSIRLPFPRSTMLSASKGLRPTHAGTSDLAVLMTKKRARPLVSFCAVLIGILVGSAVIVSSTRSLGVLPVRFVASYFCGSCSSYTIAQRQEQELQAENKKNSEDAAQPPLAGTDPAPGASTNEAWFPEGPLPPLEFAAAPLPSALDDPSLGAAFDLASAAGNRTPDPAMSQQVPLFGGGGVAGGTLLPTGGPTIVHIPASAVTITQDGGIVISEQLHEMIQQATAGIGGDIVLQIAEPSTDPEMGGGDDPEEQPIIIQLGGGGVMEQDYAQTQITPGLTMKKGSSCTVGARAKVRKCGERVAFVILAVLLSILSICIGFAADKASFREACRASRNGEDPFTLLLARRRAAPFVPTTAGGLPARRRQEARLTWQEWLGVQLAVLDVRIKAVVEHMLSALQAKWQEVFKSAEFSEEDDDVARWLSLSAKNATSVQDHRDGKSPPTATSTIETFRFKNAGNRLALLEKRHELRKLRKISSRTVSPASSVSPVSEGGIVQAFFSWARDVVYFPSGETSTSSRGPESSSPDSPAGSGTFAARPASLQAWMSEQARRRAAAKTGDDEDCELFVVSQDDQWDHAEFVSALETRRRTRYASMEEDLNQDPTAGADTGWPARGDNKDEGKNPDETTGGQAQEGQDDLVNAEDNNASETVLKPPEKAPTSAASVLEQQKHHQQDDSCTGASTTAASGGGGGTTAATTRSSCPEEDAAARAAADKKQADRASHGKLRQRFLRRLNVREVTTKNLEVEFQLINYTASRAKYCFVSSMASGWQHVNGFFPSPDPEHVDAETDGGAPAGDVPMVPARGGQQDSTRTPAGDKLHEVGRGDHEDEQRTSTSKNYKPTIPANVQNYSTVRTNVNEYESKLLQLSFCFTGEDLNIPGKESMNLPRATKEWLPLVWQVLFHFDWTRDLRDKTEVSDLFHVTHPGKSALELNSDRESTLDKHDAETARFWNERTSINWWRHQSEGITLKAFGEMLKTMPRDHLTWVSFDSQRDFAFLTQALAPSLKLPASVQGFQTSVVANFPSRVDLKHLLFSPSLQRRMQGESSSGDSHSLLFPAVEIQERVRRLVQHHELTNGQNRLPVLTFQGPFATMDMSNNWKNKGAMATGVWDFGQLMKTENRFDSTYERGVMYQTGSEVLLLRGLCLYYHLLPKVTKPRAKKEQLQGSSPIDSFGSTTPVDQVEHNGSGSSCPSAVGRGDSSSGEEEVAETVGTGAHSTVALVAQGKSVDEQQGAHRRADGDAPEDKKTAAQQDRLNTSSENQQDEQEHSSEVSTSARPKSAREEGHMVEMSEKKASLKIAELPEDPQSVGLFALSEEYGSEDFLNTAFHAREPEDLAFRPKPVPDAAAALRVRSFLEEHHKQNLQHEDDSSTCDEAEVDLDFLDDAINSFHSPLPDTYNWQQEVKFEPTFARVYDPLPRQKPLLRMRDVTQTLQDTFATRPGMEVHAKALSHLWNTGHCLPKMRLSFSHLVAGRPDFELGCGKCGGSTLLPSSTGGPPNINSSSTVMMSGGNNINPQGGGTNMMNNSHHHGSGGGGGHLARGGGGGQHHLHGGPPNSAKMHHPGNRFRMESMDSTSAASAATSSNNNFNLSRANTHLSTATTSQHGGSGSAHQHHLGEPHNSSQGAGTMNAGDQLHLAAQHRNNGQGGSSSSSQGVDHQQHPHAYSSTGGMHPQNQHQRSGGPQVVAQQGSLHHSGQLQHQQYHNLMGGPHPNANQGGPQHAHAPGTGNGDFHPFFDGAQQHQQHKGAPFAGPGPYGGGPPPGGAVAGQNPSWAGTPGQMQQPDPTNGFVDLYSGNIMNKGGAPAGAGYNMYQNPQPHPGASSAVQLQSAAPQQHPGTTVQMQQHQQHMQMYGQHPGGAAHMQQTAGNRGGQPVFNKNGSMMQNPAAYDHQQPQPGQPQHGHWQQMGGYQLQQTQPQQGQPHHPLYPQRANWNGSDHMWQIPGGGSYHGQDQAANQEGKEYAANSTVGKGYGKQGYKGWKKGGAHGKGGKK
ncbi:unnamed protein product [Amoebophrya sp. A120]|nr:unnamed protein product [Amoebophrya sp. A120]|eukprot:GSA120T00017470001.1